MSPIDVVVITAMEEETLPFLERASAVGEEVHIGNSIQRTGTLDGLNVLFVRGGIGLVNATGAATAALLRAGREAPGVPAPLVISAGSAGGLGDTVRVGDVVVGSVVINADADARAFGYELGQVPGMPASYPVPQALLEASDIGTPGHGNVNTVHHGLLVSSYSFVGYERSGLIKEQFDGVLATDMESSAIAQTCASFGAPFLAIRGISDLCGPASDADFLTHVDDAAERSAAITCAVLGSWQLAGSPRAEAVPAFA
ncbi:5'-methylthioadenosine/S-adenosylhomocysteine nucleosidase [Paeniglutamicibacter psychrophenolicus]|uniref:5'-methylthioadenosine/S-adenosylhomocysteine nucleosidase n=1 Tax=Paeniglutamicibacter psychrophenolicus TaxID=257454 RepID=UPI0027860EE8|nr:5'-methylthioadenosine/S-adenosylhomocysteine nucleosidase [Paeniglutamicibacter psychrophenolicus]MDQ0093499.1 adenosylhomocysteine nucleosidase [Paeniglutamicibacter psychrophenolicus]